METGKNKITFYQCHGTTLTYTILQIKGGKSVPWYEDIKKEMQWIFIGL